MEPLIAGGIAFGIAKGYGVMKGIDAPVEAYAAHAGLMVASKFVSNASTTDVVQRAVGSGALFAGLCYVVFQDENWALNGAVGVGASYVADILLHKAEED